MKLAYFFGLAAFVIYRVLILIPGLGVAAYLMACLIDARTIAQAVTATLLLLVWKGLVAFVLASDT